MGMIFRQGTLGFIGKAWEQGNQNGVRRIILVSHGGWSRGPKTVQGAKLGDKSKCGGKERSTTDQERCQEHPEENLAKRQCEGRVKTLGAVYG